MSKLRDVYQILMSRGEKIYGTYNISLDKQHTKQSDIKTHIDEPTRHFTEVRHPGEDEPYKIIFKPTKVSNDDHYVLSVRAQTNRDMIVRRFAEAMIRDIKMDSVKIGLTTGSFDMVDYTINLDFFTQVKVKDYSEDVHRWFVDHRWLTLIERDTNKYNFYEGPIKEMTVWL